MKDRKKPEKFWLPHGMPSDDREFAFSSRVFPKASQIKALYKLWHYQIMTAYDPDTLVRDKEITRDIYRRFEGKLALNCFVIQGGEITLGDEVQLVRGRACAASAAAAVFAD